MIQESLLVHLAQVLAFLVPDLQPTAVLVILPLHIVLLLSTTLALALQDTIKLVG